MSKNKELATVFDHMADLYLLGGKEEDRYRISSYRKIAQTLKYYPKDIATLDDPKKLQEIPGVGKAISEKIHEYLTSGKIETYEKLKARFPKTLLELMDIPSLGPKKVHLLWKELGVEDKKELAKAIEKGTIQDLPGFGEKSVENIKQGIEIGEMLKKRKLIGEMVPVVEQMREYLEKSQLTDRLEVAGSYRRRKETIGDIDFLAVSKQPKKLIDYFVDHPDCKKILAQGDTKGSIILEGDQQIDLRVVTANQWGAALQYFTGSLEHNVHLRTIAREKKMTINEYGVFQLTKEGEKGKRVAGETEESIYRKLGLQYIPPEMRTDSGEIEAAAKKKALPKLIEVKDLQGDLHSHTTYSDGINSIKEMAQAADKMGLKYLALTDHSPGLIVANGLKPKDIPKKGKEMEEVQKKSKVRLFMGTEVDILADGSLDYDNKVLKKMDVVVASVHAGFTKDNTQRILKAMENPYVTIIGHVSGRMIGSRDSYPLDYEKIFDKAAETQTWIEINSQPSRQDISWDHIRAGKKKGVKFVINTDSHTTETFWYREIGIGIARRGWLEKRDVMNTLSLRQFEKALKDQRKHKLKK